MIYVTTTFLVQKIKNNKKRTENKWGTYGVGLFTGFLQGTGVVGGSDMRNNFFFARGLTIAEVGATTAVVGAINFIFPISYRLYDGLVTISELSQLLILLPFIIFATIVGKYILKKIPKLTQDIIIYAVIIISLGLLIYRLLELLI
jgi:uncharacterized membrane protein YfcA